MSQRTNTYLFAGGLDPSTSPLLLPPGRVMSGINYEAVMEGYRRMDGIERFDGRPAPSECRFHTLRFTAGSVEIEAGDVVVGAGSGATGTVVLGARPDQRNVGSG